MKNYSVSVVVKESDNVRVNYSFVIQTTDPQAARNLAISTIGSPTSFTLSISEIYEG